MWRPFTKTGTPVRLSSLAVMRIADQTAAVVICYEQVIRWPTLTAFLDGPTMMIAVTNQFWLVRQSPKCSAIRFARGRGCFMCAVFASNI